MFLILFAIIISCKKKDNQKQPISDWTIYTYANSTLTLGYAINTLFVDKSVTLWVSSDYLHRYDGNTWSKFDISNTGIFIFWVTDGLKTNSDINWFSSKAGLIKLQNNSWSLYNINNSSLPSSSINGIAIDPQNNLWLATDEGVVKYDGGSNWITYDESNTPMPCRYARFIKSTSDGIIWVGVVLNTVVCPGALTGCLARYKNGNWSVFTSSNSNLPEGNMSTIEIDKNGNIWLAIERNLLKYNGTDFDNYIPSNSIIHSDCLIQEIAFDKQNNLWLATDEGVFKFNGSIWKNFTSQNSALPEDNVSSLAIDNNNTKWFATSDKVTKYTGD